MTILTFINELKSLMLQHKYIKEVQIGTSFDEGHKVNSNYPLVFIEIPIYYNLQSSGIYNVRLAINILEKPKKRDDINSDLEAISFADEILIDIVNKLNDYNDLDIRVKDDYTVVTYNQFTNDLVSGIRAEINFLIKLNCNTNNNWKLPIE